MPDEFGARPEADLYRITLYLSEFPDHRVTRKILGWNDDESVSFARFWLHNEQPKPLVPGHLFDTWLVERYTREHVYETVQQGLADRTCRWTHHRRRSFRDWKEEQTGASEYRNGIGALDKETPKRSRTRRNGLAKRRTGGEQRSARTLTPFQQKMREIREEAKRKVEAKPSAPISETRERWRQMVNRNRPSTARNGDG